jgi:hypothetical protein
MDSHRTPRPHLALPLAASVGEINRVQEARKIRQTAASKRDLHFMCMGWVFKDKRTYVSD